MAKYQAKIYVTLKPTVNDPQGLTIKGGLHMLGFASVAEVRAGKFLEITLSADSLSQAQQQVEEMCRRLLANPVIERYRFEVAEVT